MDDSYCLLPERISEQFSEIDSDIVMDLAAASPEYAKLKAQMEELKRQNPVIGALLEGKGELSFTAEEHEAWKEFIRLYMRADIPAHINPGLVFLGNAVIQKQRQIQERADRGKARLISKTAVVGRQLHINIRLAAPCGGQVC